ncbi:DUF3592 domain-containing protein [Dyella telluris]|uniref:DUF3592 domain-containing protein n=1 Tax=Dyella telluris TaxID=2763498 RepID=A0A7G8Q3U2_9GAMM|nr:DUF3592 domain-containing protein [Dyella telluris]QNK01450.1 DUF3592 domain-containing protein [Dyella telluris]
MRFLLVYLSIRLFQGMVLLTFGGVLAYQIYQLEAQRSWPSTEAAAVTSIMVPRWISGKSMQKIMVPGVAYTYVVAGKKYAAVSEPPRNDRPMTMGSTGRLTVYYDPADPGTSVVELAVWGWHETVVLAVFLIMIFACFSPRKKTGIG